MSSGELSDEIPDNSSRTSGVIGDWSEVNQQLRHHGFHPVMILTRSRIDRIPKGAVVLEEHTTKHLCHTLENLMSDCDRRQALVQELISASNRMQRENKEYIETIHSHELEIRELKQQLEAERVHTQEMEDRRLSELHRHGEEVHGLKMTRKDVMALFKQMEQKILNKDDEIARMQRRCEKLVQKEEERLDRQSNMFHQFKNRYPKTKHDKKLLEVIDIYEAKLDKVREELDQLREKRDDHNASYVGSYGDVQSDSQPVSEVDSEVLSKETIEEESCSPLTGTRKGVGEKWKMDRPKRHSPQPAVENCEKSLKDAKQLIRLLESENTHLKMELQTRPMPTEWKKTQKYNKKLEKILAKNNLSPPSRKRHLDKEASEHTEFKRFSTHADDIDLLPIDACRKYLKETCSMLLVLDLRDLHDRLKSIDLMTEAFPSMEQFIKDVLALIHEYGALQSNNLQESIDTHAVFCQRAWEDILPTLRLWAEELSSLKNLQRAIVELSACLMPWETKSKFKIKDKNSIRVRDLMAMVESLSHKDRRAGPNDVQGGEKPSFEQLQSIIAHFQKLFDVHTVSGVFPRMNELYLRVGEVYNAMHTMRELLHLDPTCKPANIVNAVGKLSKARHLLKVDDISGVIKRLEQYDEFFPAFQSMVNELSKILGVEKMDEIVTAVKALIKFPHY